MKIWELIPKEGAGMTAYAVMNLCHDANAELEDITEALRWAVIDGKVQKVGKYYWRVA